MVDGAQVGHQRRRGALWSVGSGQGGQGLTRVLRRRPPLELPMPPCTHIWPAPTHLLQVPEETQFLLAELAAAEGGQGPGQGYVLLLPLIDSGAFRATLRPPTRCAAGLSSNAGVCSAA